MGRNSSPVGNYCNNVLVLVSLHNVTYFVLVTHFLRSMCLSYSPACWAAFPLKVFCFWCAPQLKRQSRDIVGEHLIMLISIKPIVETTNCIVQSHTPLLLPCKEHFGSTSGVSNIRPAGQIWSVAWLDPARGMILWNKNFFVCLRSLSTYTSITGDYRFQLLATLM